MRNLQIVTLFIVAGSFIGCMASDEELCAEAAAYLQQCTGQMAEAPASCTAAEAEMMLSAPCGSLSSAKGDELGGWFCARSWWPGCAAAGETVREGHVTILDGTGLGVYVALREADWFPAGGDMIHHGSNRLIVFDNAAMQRAPGQVDLNSFAEKVRDNPAVLAMVKLKVNDRVRVVSPSKQIAYEIRVTDHAWSTGDSTVTLDVTVTGGKIIRGVAEGDLSNQGGLMYKGQDNKRYWLRIHDLEGDWLPGTESLAKIRVYGPCDSALCVTESAGGSDAPKEYDKEKTIYQFTEDTLPGGMKLKVGDIGDNLAAQATSFIVTTDSNYNSQSQSI